MGKSYMGVNTITDPAEPTGSLPFMDCIAVAYRIDKEQY